MTERFKEGQKVICNGEIFEFYYYCEWHEFCSLLKDGEKYYALLEQVFSAGEDGVKWS